MAVRKFRIPLARARGMLIAATLLVAWHQLVLGIFEARLKGPKAA
jgi:hypothetical protein